MSRERLATVAAPADRVEGQGLGRKCPRGRSHYWILSAPRSDGSSQGECKKCHWHRTFEPESDGDWRERGNNDISTSWLNVRSGPGLEEAIRIAQEGFRGHSEF